MYRRRFVGAIAPLAVSLTGCTSGDGGDDLRDSDGDGMIDSQDYAPEDPSVQRKSDLVTSAEPTSTETGMGSSSGTTPDPETETSSGVLSIEPETESTPGRPDPDAIDPDSDSIVVDDAYWTGQSYIAGYGAGEVQLRIHPDRPRAGYDRMRVALLVAEYPRRRTLAVEYSETFERDGTQRVAVPVHLDDAPTGTRLYYSASLVPAGETLQSADSDDVATIMETDPFEKRPDGSIERSPHPAALGDERGTGYERNAVEGAYELTFTGRTLGEAWTVNFFGLKSAYLAAAQTSRGRSRTEYVSYEMTEGSAGVLAGILDEQADANGFTGKREKVEFVIDFVQRLPYVPDDVSTGYDDFTKFIMETLVELGGDCEDTAIMLVAILQSEPFNYDMVLIQPPGHMAAGIWSEEPRGYYYTYGGRSYEYIETTGEGWGIGDCPEEYQGERAYVFQV